MSFSVTLSIPINFDDNYVKTLPMLEYVAQINNEFQPVYNLNGIRLPNDEFDRWLPMERVQLAS
jgi:hypothetical protein